MRLSASLPLAVLAFSALAFSTQSQSAAQTVAATPPMGWNSWNYFADKVTDKDIRELGRRDGLQRHARRRLHLRQHRRHLGRRARRAAAYIHTNNKFPDMKALADYVHSKGLKLGIYSVARAPDLRRTMKAATGTRSRTRRRTPTGASTT